MYDYETNDGSEGLTTQTMIPGVHINVSITSSSSLILFFSDHGLRLFFDVGYGTVPI